MSALRETGALISIGGAILYTIGLNPQRISTASEARFPAHAIPGGLHYQATGLGERSTTIEATTYPHVMGGMDAYAILRAHHELQAMVPLIRVSGNLKGLSSGLCVIQTLEADEERLHPFDGVGRQIDVSIGLIMMPGTSFFLGRSGGSSMSNFGGSRR